MIGLLHSRPQCLRVWECARKLWEALRRSSQNLAIWASQRMLFDPTKTFSFFYVYFIAKVLCCFGIRTEEIQLTALKNFQASKALVVAAENIPLRGESGYILSPNLSQIVKHIKLQLFYVSS